METSRSITPTLYVLGGSGVSRSQQNTSRQQDVPLLMTAYE